MKYVVFFLIVFFPLFIIKPLQAQTKRNKGKTVYYGKLQGAYMVDKLIPKGYGGFNYINLGLRKVTGKKIREYGLEAFYYQKVHDKEIINEFYNEAYKQRGYGIKYYHYVMLKQWNFKRLNLQIGPQFSLGYFRNHRIPQASFAYAININDYKLGGSARMELNYKINRRYSFILGAQYTLFQFGLRRMYIDNPNLTNRQKLEDFIQFDYLVNRYAAYAGVLAQFGKIKVDRAIIEKKRKKQRAKQQAKNQKKKEKRVREVEKRRTKVTKKKEKKKSKNKK